MVRRFLARINAPVRGVHQAAYALAALTLVSQALALARDRIFAHSFGAGHTLDLYYAAFRVPDLVFAVVSSLVSAYVLIPRITGLDRERTRELLSESATFLLALGGAVCLALAALMPRFLALLYPNLAAAPDAGAFILLARLLLLQPIFLGLAGVVGSVTQVHRRFVLFALAPVLYNLGIIFGTVVLYPRYGLAGIGAGVLAGAAASLFIHLPVLRGAGVFPRLALPSFARMLPVVRDSVPRSLALGVGSAVLLALTALASRVGTGAVSVFTFAGNLEAVPLALIGSSYAVAAFPALSEASGKEGNGEFSRILSTSARHIILWSFVFIGLVLVLRAHIVRVVLGSGAFGWDATRLTAALLAILVVGLAAQGFVLLFSRALYAAHQSWRPLLYQLAGGALTIALARFLLALPSAAFAAPLATLLKVGGVAGTPVLLIALAATAGQVALALLSLAALSRAAPGVARALARPIAGGIFAAFAGGSAAYATLALLGGLAPLTTLAAVSLEGAAAGSAGLAAAGLALFIIGNEEFRDILRALARLSRARAEHAAILAPSAEEPAQL